MRRPSCPNCDASLFWGGRRSDRKFDLEGRKWYEFAGYRQYCRNCGVRIRLQGGRSLAVAFVVFLLGNGFAHWAVSQKWGYVGLGMLYAAWLALLVVLWSRVRFVRFDPRGK